MLLSEEITSIQSQGFQPCINVHVHRDIYGNVCPCCVAANALFRSEVIAASSFSNDGIMGVLSLLQKKFQWGVERCHYLCDMLANAHQIDCGCGMGLALIALQESMEHRRMTMSPTGAKTDDPTMIQLVAVQVIMKTDVANTRYFRGLLDNMDRLTENHHWQWITEHLCYHQCIGFYSPSTRMLRIWDYDGWFPLDKEQQCEESGIVSIKVTPYHPSRVAFATSHYEDFGAQLLSDTVAHNHGDHKPLLWDGLLSIPIGTWVNLNDEKIKRESLACCGDLLAPMGDCCDTDKFLHEVAALMYPPIKKHPVASFQSIGGGCMTDDEQAANLSPAPLALSVTAYMTSCHMSSTPFPGIGIARSLRSWQCTQPLHPLVNANNFLCFQVQPKSLTLIGVDDMDADPLCGLTDPCFDSTKDLMILGQMRRSCSKWSSFNDLECIQLWNEVVEMLNVRNNEENCCSFFIPGIDVDVYFLATHIAQERKRIEAVSDISMSSMQSKMMARKLQIACDSILCPSLEALTLTEKPFMKGGVSTGLFKLPEYYVIEPSSSMGASASSFESMLLDAQSFCDQVGYPILVKGEQHGAQSCYTWPAVSLAIAPYLSSTMMNKSRCFLQKIIRGIEKTIAFAAVEGELTGCVMMTKTIVTSAGKVWTGIVSPVSEYVMKALQDFVKTAHWHGGGELEFIETIDDGLQHYPDGESQSPGSVPPCWYLIDFNPRFPAWISACVYTGCNLPADMIAHACLVKHHQRQTKSSEHNVLPSLDVIERNRKRYLSFPQISFTKSVMEIPLAHHMIGLQTLLGSERQGGTHLSKSKSHNNGHADHHSQDHSDARSEMRRSTLACNSMMERGAGEREEQAMGCFQINPMMSKEESELIAAVNKALSLNEARDDLLSEHKILSNLKQVSTPCYFLSTAIVKDSLFRHQRVISNAIATANERNRQQTLQEQGSNRMPMRYQMSISVKTQPLQAVLQKAHEMNYFAECISLAEVRAALDAGFQDREIILTGPGKFWDKPEVHKACFSNRNNKPFTFAAIFADSLMDLYRILQRINDPLDWLKTELVGVRFQPPGVHNSRFGLNVQDSTAFMAAAAMIRHCLPADIKLGVHLHFAASAPSMSPEKWFGIAQATIEVAHQFAALCQRNIDVMDFGGGFSADFMRNEKNVEAMTNLCSTANKLLRCSSVDDARGQPVERSLSRSTMPSEPLVIEFELGKCITEKSGALLCRVLEIRELWVSPPIPHQDSLVHHSSWFDAIDNEAQVEAMMSRLYCRRKAIIVDASVGEICCMHVHPIYWRSANSPITNDQQNNGWQSFLPGSDEIWGRTCMEFDQLVGVRSSWGSVGGRCGTGVQCVAVPENMQVGDVLLITCCGSYDMTMQYDFGDGVGRSHCTVVD